MKTSLVIATLAVLGAGAVSAGAAHFVPSTAGNGVPFQGSDTEGDLTNAAIDPCESRRTGRFMAPVSAPAVTSRAAARAPAKAR